MGETSSFLSKWKSQQSNVMTRIFPGVPEKKLNKFINKQVEKRLINREVVIHNNYFDGAKKLTLLDTIDWIERKKPIMAGFGMFYENQHNSINPNAEMLRQFLSLRKVYKKRLDFLDPESYEYMMADQMQLTEKINANAFYGCNGSKVSRFFNIYVASSVTLTGQSLNSTSGQAFEAFLKNAVKFYDLDNCFTWLENIREESYKGANFDNIPTVTVQQVYNRMKEMFFEFKDEYSYPLFNYLMNSSQKQLKKFYYKNNLYEFSKLPHIESRTIEALREIDVTRNDYEVPEDLQDDMNQYETTGIMPDSIRRIMKVSFVNPNHAPKEIKKTLDYLWSEYQQFVFYNYPTWDRIHRMKHAPRKVVPMADTDSNFVHLDPWVQYVDGLIQEDDYLLSKDQDELWYATINIMSYYLTKMINEVLFKYTSLANVPEEFRANINMKNEFLYRKLFTTPTKKRYIGAIRLREGNVLLPEKVDLKGHEFVKSTTRDDARKYFKSMIQNRLLDADKIDIPGIYRDLKVLKDSINESIASGEKKYTSPMKVKNFDVYDKPLSEQSVRATMAWNAAYPTETIQPPEKIDVIKVKMAKLDDIASLEQTHPEIYNNLRRGIYENSNPEIVAKGITVFGIPQKINEVPEWILPFVDTQTIRNDTVNRFVPVLESLGISTVTMDNKTFYSNIKKLG